MLEQIDVDGFKSLTRFTLDIRPGLNILAGPNGAGKSNIVLFFEFLSHLSNFSVMQAVSKVGGAGAIFTRIGNQRLSQQLSFSIRGMGDYRPRFRPERQKRQPPRTMQYEFKATIQLQMELATLSFHRQELRMFECDAKQPTLDFGPLIPALEIIWDYKDKSEGKTTISTIDPTILSPAYYRDEQPSFDIKEFLSKSRL